MPKTGFILWQAAEAEEPVQGAFPEMAAEMPAETEVHHGPEEVRSQRAEHRPGPELRAADPEEEDLDTEELPIPMTAKTVIIRGSSMEAEAAAGTAAEPEQSKTVHMDAAEAAEADI